MNRRRDVEIGDLIRLARENAGLTQHQLSAKAGLSLSAVAQWEKPNDPKSPSLQSLQRVCDALGITIGELFHTSRRDALTERETELLRLFKKLNADQQIAYLTVLRGSAR